MAPATGEPIATPPARVSAWNVANLLTLARLVLVPVFVALLFVEGTEWRLGAFVVFVLAAVTDLIDGELARRRGLVTDFGKIADPIADKALIGGALVSLSLLGELTWWVTAVIVAREAGITLLRLCVLRHGVIPASRGGKAKTVLQIVAVAAYVLPGPLDPVRLAAMAGAVVVTLATGVDYVVHAWRLWRASAAGRG